MTKIVGTSVPVVDGFAKVTGRGKYAQDMKLPGMLFGRTLRSPLPHARIVSIDTSKAKAMPGVAAVLTAEDMPASSFTRPLDVGPLLVKDRVRYVGDAVAVVAAVDVATAIQAVNAIEVKYEPLPSVLDPAEAMKPGAPQLYDEGNVGYDLSLNGKNLLMERGDVAQGLAQADRVFQGQYHVAQQQNSSPGPRSTLAVWEGDQLTVWSPNQGVHGLRADLAATLGMSESKIRVLAAYSTGGYGSGNHAKGANFMPASAALLAWRTGRPVKMEFTRWEEIIVGMGRHPASIDLKMGVKNDGTVIAVDSRSIANAGAYGDFSVVFLIVNEYLTGMYRAPHQRAESIYVVTNRPHAREMRSFGSPQAHFALESLADEAALGLNMDPLDFRLKNHLQEGDPWGGFGQTVSSIGFDEALNKAAAAFGWREARSKYPIKDGNRVRGIGMAITNQSPVQSPSSALVELRPDGSVLARPGSGNMGQAAVTAMGQIVAEELGLEWGDVRVVFGDTDATAYDLYSLGSRAALNTGHAFRIAAQEVLSKLTDRAAVALKVTTEDVEYANKRFTLKSDPSTSVDFHQVMGTFGGGSITGSGYMDLGASQKQQVSNAAYFVEVEVNTATGRVRPLRLVVAQDWGKVINPNVVRSQMEGALIMGIGYAMSEDVIIDRGTGIPTNGSWLEYKLPMAQDIPDIQTILVESNDSLGAYGIKGGGETCLAGPAPAIANAVFNAVGVRIRDLPITAEKVLSALNSRA